MKGQAEFSRQPARKGQVAVSLFAAQAVMQMGGVQHQPQLLASFRQSAH
jgi:hypothetical protein